MCGNPSRSFPKIYLEFKMHSGLDRWDAGRQVRKRGVKL